MCGVAAGGDLRQERTGGVADIADEWQVDGAASTDLLATDVDLDDGRLRRIELFIGEVGAQHEQCVALLDRPVSGREAEQPGHSHVVGVVVLDEFLAPQRVHDGGLQGTGELDDLVVRPLHPRPGENSHALGGVESVCGAVDLGIGGPGDPRDTADGGAGAPFRARRQEGLARDDEDRHILFLDRGAQGDVEQARHLVGRADHLAEGAAFPEQLLGVGLLEVAGADLRRRDVRGDREDRDTTAVCVEQSVDQVQVAGPATSHAHREFTGERGFGGRGERRRLLVSDMPP